MQAMDPLKAAVDGSTCSLKTAWWEHEQHQWIHEQLNATERTRKGNDATTTKQANEQGEVGRLGGLEDSVEWMVQHEWLTAEEAVGLSAKALSTSHQHEVSKDSILVSNLGEGWRSVARGVEAAFPGAIVVGADKRGFTWVGATVGKITAELKHDWSTATTDLITALSKKAGPGVSVHTYIHLILKLLKS